MRRLVAAALVAALMLGAGSAGGQAPDPGDAKISAAVEALLWQERSLAGADIHVESKGGEVTLRGFARTMEEIATAARVARSVPGVRGVTNTIRVSITPPRG